VIASISSVNAQSTGSIGGIVTDKSNNETLIGANVLIVGTTNGASTDIDGAYSIKGLKPGNYNLRVSYISYQAIVIENILVKAGTETKINVSLQPASTELQEVVITAEALQSTESAVLKIQKNSLNIVDGISAELISKNNSSDGTDILKRMTGVTISEGKYAFVRGVGDRYNNTMLNGANLPSTDPEKKSFSYDLFPASLIENVMTSKTFTPDKPADFTGGLVEINTIEFPNKFILDISASSSYNTETSFKDFMSYNGGGTDWLGYDDGTRDYPSLINGNKVGKSYYTQDERQKIGQAFADNWQTVSNKAPMNGSFKVSVGNKYDLSENDVVGFIGSVNYSNSAESKQIERNNYTYEGPRYTYSGTSSSRSVNLGAMLNVSYKFAQAHKISFKNMFNQNSDDETTFYEGDYYYNPDYRRVTSLRFVSRSLLSSQVIGEHHLGFMNGFDVNWNVNYANSKRDEPDARRYVYKRDDNDLSVYRFLMDASTATRFFGNLDDVNKGAGTDFTLKPFSNPSMPKLKFGFHYDWKDRSFSARTFGFMNNSNAGAPSNESAYEDSVLKLSPAEIFQSQNFNKYFIEVSEITKPSDSYSSNQSVTAGYFMTDFDVLGTIKVIAGVRYEKSQQEMLSHLSTGEEVKTNPDYEDWLPSVNMTVPVSEQMNVRLAFTKTLARPEFRELAPFSYFDFLANELVQGNIDLKRAKITNYDLRYEYFPGARELYAVSFFYKKFIDPIEQVLISSSAFEPIRSYENANSAENYGVEFELRKGFEFVGKNFNNFFFVGNLSLISSKIKLDNNGFQVSERPLQGQADFIMNLGLYYDEPAGNLSASLIYNKVGERISKVGYAGLGDIIEKPRDQVDFSVSRNLLPSLNIKLTVKDLLAQDHLFIQKSPLGDKVAERWKAGRNISIGLDYKL